MSTSSRSKQPAGGRRARASLTSAAEVQEENWRLPATVSRPPLLENGSDGRFRQLVTDLFTIALRMEQVREHLAERMGITGPQYSVLMGVARLQGRAGVAVGALARQLHVSSAFIATETGKLAQAGFLRKRPNQHDRRGVLLMLTRAGRLLIERHAADIRALNDLFFGGLTQRSFAAMSRANEDLVLSSEHALRRVRASSPPAKVFREAAE
jgi:MarR family transcriptional regulator, organic hydroperoxide resistance regulator